MTTPAWKKFALFAGVLTTVLLLPWLGRPLVLVLTLAILGRCAYELYGSLRAPPPAFRTAICSAYMLLGIAFLCFAIVLPLKSISYASMIVLAFSLRCYGLPRLGLAGGAAAALAVAILIGGGTGVVSAIENGVSITAAALAGALVASWIKRRSGIKGFGRSGRSGVLDYFDGFLFAAPVALALLQPASAYNTGMPDGADRILTTHCGSLPRPKPLLDLMKKKLCGQPYDQDAYAAEVRVAVDLCVRQQRECGIDIPTDGEQGKSGFYVYMTERLGGFEARPGRRQGVFAAELEAFPEYYQEYFSHAMLGATLAPLSSFVCTGPVTYRGQEAARQDVDNLKSALNGLNPADAFLPAVAPSGVGKNEYYRTEQEFLHRVAEAMRNEYLAIVEAGFQLQVDDPFLTELYSYSQLTPVERRKTGEMYVEALNYALRGIPTERVRYHTCYGINEGPRVHDAPLKDLIDLVLKVNASAYSFEAANPRHEHEYRVWETVKLPEGKTIIPGVITHASNIVEHPEWIAERIVRYARLVGRDNVIAGADCGFSSQATYHPEVHPTVIWAKFTAMAEGARLASEQLWRG